MVVTKKEFQDFVDQINEILKNLDSRLQDLEKTPTTKPTKGQEKT